MEIVVVDDGSTDGTDALLADQAARGVVTVRHERPLGVAQARNAGIVRASAPWVAFLDDDDVWAPRKLSEQLEAAWRSNRPWVYSSVVLVDERLRPLGLAAAPDPVALQPGLLRRNMLAGGASSVCVKAELLRATGGFDPRFHHLGDWDLWLRLAARAPAVSCGQIHTAYVVHPGGMVPTDPRGPLAEVTLLQRKHAELYARHDSAPNRAVVAAWVAARLLLVGQRTTAIRLYLRSAIQDRDTRNLGRALLTAVGLDRVVARIRHPPPQPPEWLLRCAADG